MKFTSFIAYKEANVMGQAQPLGATTAQAPQPAPQQNQQQVQQQQQQVQEEHQ